WLSEKQFYDLAHNLNTVFGYLRLHILDLIDLLLQSDFYIVIDTLMDPSVNFFPVAIQCMKDFPHSTFCHKFVESILQQCFVAQPADIILKVCEKEKKKKEGEFFIFYLFLNSFHFC
ncbi:hypothetical protein M1146_06760, partial [Patescibacteria group bacterium]|nr:hypothetical protein [Patescibacteria group bacterium]